jgi:biopolymer transport protein ExbB
MELLCIVLLVIASIVGLTFIVERGLALRWKNVLPLEVEDAVNSFQTNGDLLYLQETCQRHSSPLSRLLLFAGEHRHWPKTENAEALQTKARHEIVKLERGLVVLEIIVGIAPLLGLVGTIYGLIMLFGGMGQIEMGNASPQVAAGIALALRATLMGLLTAIPSLIAWSYFNKKVETMAVEMENVCEQFLRALYREDHSATSQKNYSQAEH